MLKLVEVCVVCIILTNTFSPPKPTDTFVELTTVVATSTNSVGANLKMVPNQPIVFKVGLWVSHSSNTHVHLF